jgi:dolichol-phosphate mannosyltransferase
MSADRVGPLGADAGGVKLSDTEAPAISVVLPSFREAENLRVLLPDLTAVLARLSPRWEVIVVDTMEPMDDSAELCAISGATYVNRRGGDDYGNAIRTGIDESTGSRVVIMDVDGSHDPQFLETLWAHRDEGDIVIASRYVRGGTTDNPLLLVLFSKLLNAVFSTVVGIPVRDLSNSFRLYRGEQLRAIRLDSRHFDIQEEILARLLWETDPAASCIEIPFRFKRRAHGESKRSTLLFVVAFLGAMGRLRRLRVRIAADLES